MLRVVLEKKLCCTRIKKKSRQMILLLLSYDNNDLSKDTLQIIFTFQVGKGSSKLSAWNERVILGKGRDYKGLIKGQGYRL